MPKFIIVEAVIGAGKSTLLTLLAKALEKRGIRTVCIPEPVDIWHETGALQAFYQDIAGMAYEFQSFAYVTRCMRTREYCAANPGADVFLIERSVVSDRHLFVKMLEAAGKFTPLQITLMRVWHDQWVHLLPFAAPTAFVYLAPSLDATLQRIANRNRSGETVSRDYQEALLQKHEEIFGTGIGPQAQDVAVTTIANGTPVPVLRLYTDDDYRTEEEHPLLDRICTFIMEQ